ncbi:MAG: DNA gyrase inhibitor YacG [Henriciella sp.]|jgi:endogenous inhibitor of DNA gyrase (YacG/DUF329 family)|nr:DNA gyrase inhibitor YacG [Henriciella sp.]
MSVKICAMCENKPIDPKFKPFCSKRCADLDLSKWLKGSYAIPGLPSDQADEVPDTPDPSDA